MEPSRRPKLLATTVLCATPGIALERETAGTYALHAGRGSARVGAAALAVLEAFHTATPLEVGLERLRSRIGNVADLADVMQTIRQLHEMGALSEPGADRVSPELEADVEAHAQTLNDHVRARAFIAAIGQSVRPGDVVLEIGTGTGIFAVAAARAGARRVYAIEQGPIGSVARAVFRANGVDDRVTLIEGWAEDVELPERADVLITDLVGDDPLGVHVREVCADALRRHLKPGARLVPSRIRVLGSPVQIADHALVFSTAPGTVLANWRSWYGMDFAPLAGHAPPRESSFLATSAAARGWTVLGPSVTFADLDLASPERAPVRGRRTIAAERAGRLDALVTCFELQVGPTVAYSTCPALAADGTIWKHRVVMLDLPLALVRGQRFEVTWRQPFGQHGHQITAAVRRAPERKRHR